MDAVNVLQSVANSLSQAIQQYSGYELNLRQLARLVQVIVCISEAAACCDPTGAEAVIDKLVDGISMVNKTVARMTRMSMLQRVVKMPSIREEMADIGAGIGQCLNALSAPSFQLTMDLQARLSRVQSSWFAWCEEQCQTKEDVQLASALQDSRFTAEQEQTIELLLTMMTRLDVGPKQLAAEVYSYSKRSTASDGPETSAELQVRGFGHTWQCITPLLSARAGCSRIAALD
jgi:hypothetical protein